MRTRTLSQAVSALTDTESRHSCLVYRSLFSLKNVVPQLLRWASIASIAGCFLINPWPSTHSLAQHDSASYPNLPVCLWASFISLGRAGVLTTCCNCSPHAHWSHSFSVCYDCFKTYSCIFASSGAFIWIQEIRSIELKASILRALGTSCLGQQLFQQLFCL